MSNPGPTDPVSVPDAEPEAGVVSVAAVVSPLELSSELPHPATASAAATAPTAMTGNERLIGPPSIVWLSQPLYAAGRGAVLASEADYRTSGLVRAEERVDRADLAHRILASEQRRALAADGGVQVLELQPVGIRRLDLDALHRVVP